jgi:hypothetical protein
MPLELRELVIRVNVDEKTDTPVKEVILPELKKEIVEECKKELIAWLERQSDR